MAKTHALIARNPPRPGLWDTYVHGSRAAVRNESGVGPSWLSTLPSRVAALVGRVARDALKLHGPEKLTQREREALNLMQPGLIDHPMTGPGERLAIRLSERRDDEEAKARG